MIWHLFVPESRANSVLFSQVQRRPTWIQKELKITVKRLMVEGRITISLFTPNRADAANALISPGLSVLRVIIQSQTEVVFPSWEEIWDKRERERGFRIRMSPRALEVFSRRKGEGAAAQSCGRSPRQSLQLHRPHQNEGPTFARCRPRDNSSALPSVTSGSANGEAGTRETSAEMENSQTRPSY